MGTVTLQRFQFPDQPGFWDIARVTYDLQPTPEPTTLLLFGTSATGLALARWYRQKRAHAA